MPNQTERKSKFEAAKAWVVGLTGVLVVLPALVNAGIDIYSAWQKLPKTESERINVGLFKKYFNKQPVAAFPVPIKQNNGIVEVKFSIYEEGDLFVEFGKFTQWFPFPGGENQRVSFGVISSAIAGELSKLSGFGHYQQRDRTEEDYLVRERLYENGIQERLLLNPRTGDILDSSSSRIPSNSNDSPNSPRQAVSNFAPIDLDAIRGNPSLQQTGTAVICYTQLGSCQMVSPVPMGAPCVCYSSGGPIAGISK